MTAQPEQAKRILVLGVPDAAGEFGGDVAVVVRLLLSRLGYEVHVAVDPDQAAKLLEFAEWDLLIISSLKYWGGLEIYKNPPKKVLRLALSADPALHQAGDPAAEAFIQKPFAPDELIRIVESLLEQAPKTAVT